MIYSTTKASLPLNLQRALTDRVHLQFRHNCGYSRRNYFASNLLLAGRDATSLAFLTEALKWKFLCENNCVARNHGDDIILNLQQGAKKKYNIFFMVKKEEEIVGSSHFSSQGPKTGVLSPHTRSHILIVALHLLKRTTNSLEPIDCNRERVSQIIDVWITLSC